MSGGDDRQPMRAEFFAVVAKSAREVFRIGIRDPTGSDAKIELRVIERRPNGLMRPTPKVVVIPSSSINEIVNALVKAKRHACAMRRPPDE